jgi:uncharacterized circularly permuted ATP-grasp superfamily protein/uncharacterized alpha-E superfamily protein
MSATDNSRPAAAASLFDGLVFPENAYCEAFSSATVPRKHWEEILAAVDASGTDLLKQRQERVRRMRHADGATFNLFDDANTRGTPWALEMIPFPITSADWSVLEAGLVQRALLLEQVLADVYGPQQLLRDGVIPAELIYANPRFLRPCHGIQPVGNRFLSFYAADVYRATDGRFRVLRDYGAAPGGLGYALENRIVISRIFSGLYHHTQIRRLAPFFQSFHSGVIQRSARRPENPGIVLLSSGPESRIYFEHALLSRYLGYPLVEGQDLTVRNGQVFLKKLGGLEPVEAIFRHVDDEGSDPFALRSKAVSGVAGLIQAARERYIDIVNPIGSGFMETPALPAFLPGLCRRIMDADLTIENHPIWWCGDENSRREALTNWEQVDLMPALDEISFANQPVDKVRAVADSPHAFIARAPVRPAVVPTWNGNHMEAGYALLRVFACATERGFTIMPGGLAITAGDVKTLLDDCRERQQSKDIWVFSDNPVEPFSLLSGLQSAAEFSRSSDLPSRVADHLLWLGRYLERAEALIRLLRSVFRKLSGEARLEDIPDLMFLLNFLRKQHGVPIISDAAGACPRYRELTIRLTDALYRQDRPESVVFVLKQVKEAARNVRDRLSLDSWRVINRLGDLVDTSAEDPLDFLDDTLFTLNAFSGLSMESMTRGLGWRFMDMGRRMERAMGIVELIRIGLPRIYAESRSALEALLEVADSIMTYRARYRTTFQLAPVLDLLLVDESNPKSLAFQCSQLAGHVEQLPRQSDRRYSSVEERMTLEMLTSVRLLDLSGLDGNRPSESLTSFLSAMETWLIAFSQRISAHYLSRVAATPHFAGIIGDQEA